ncbi:hypothetical protein V5799_032267 [Amblyomma americanum]|uniref:Uncharacterized protein n=1 Tax=Amblyomma americanum TaxID=6943 RepID=A0AAQ4DRP6_AMBAM
MAKEEAASDAEGGWVDFSLELSDSGSSERRSPCQVSTTQGPEAVCPPTHNVSVKKANVVYNIVVTGGEAEKVFNILGNQNQSDYGPIYKRTLRSPTKRNNVTVEDYRKVRNSFKGLTCAAAKRT